MLETCGSADVSAPESCPVRSASQMTLIVVTVRPATLWADWIWALRNVMPLVRIGRTILGRRNRMKRLGFLGTLDSRLIRYHRRATVSPSRYLGRLLPR